jgi:hypothetical protein
MAFYFWLKDRRGGDLWRICQRRKGGLDPYKKLDGTRDISDLGIQMDNWLREHLKPTEWRVLINAQLPTLVRKEFYMKQLQTNDRLRPSDFFIEFQILDHAVLFKVKFL